jgi:Zn-dependent peptidase ImmA (M78 family)
MRRLERAWKAADQLLLTHQVRHAPVDVESIASKHASVVYRSLDPDISGVLMPLDHGKWAIVVNADHSPVRQRFTIAHELGHIFLHSFTTPHADRAFRFRDARSSEGSALEEVQANQFAAELLMPRRLVLKVAIDSGFQHAPSNPGDDETFEAWVREMAEQFDVSRQAMTVRLSSILS